MGLGKDKIRQNKLRYKGFLINQRQSISLFSPVVPAKAIPDIYFF
jgi:hypothetical protein